MPAFFCLNHDECVQHIFKVMQERTRRSEAETYQMKRSMQKRLEALKANYMIQLVEALERCAHGKYGLLDQNQAVLNTLNKQLRSRLSSQDAEDLLELGSLIEKLRLQLGYMDAFPPHQRLLKIRSSTHPNSPGEPKLARAWLEELSGESGQDRAPDQALN